MADKHVFPVSQELWNSRDRIFPNLRFKAVGFFTFFAPAEGFVEKMVEETIIFRHKNEPYYSMFNGGHNLKANFEVGVEMLPGVLLGSVEDELLWRVGSVDNVKDWMDPEAWEQGNFQVWEPAAKGKTTKKPTDWGTIALILGVGYVLTQDK